MIQIPNAKMFEGMLVGGAPKATDLGQAAKDGYKTIIDLRPPNETGVAEEQKQLAALGVKYVSIPTAGEAGLMKENAAALDDALKNAGPGKVMVHCKSGNRVGALFALRAKWNQGKSAEEALAIGKATGLTGLEPAWKRLREKPEEQMYDALPALPAAQPL